MRNSSARNPTSSSAGSRNEEIAALDFRPAVLRLPLLAHVSGAKSAAPLHFLHKDS